MQHNKKSDTVMYVVVRLIPLLIAIVVLILVIKSVFGSEKKEVTAEPETQIEVIDETISSQEETPETETLMDEDDIQLENGEGTKVDVRELKVAMNENENSEITFGIDVAKWQGTIDWQQVADSGVQFAMIRVGYRTGKTGEITEDPTAKYNLQEAQAAGIKIGAYFFSSAISKEEAKEEADWTADYIAQYAITYPVAYNCEGFLSADNRQYNLTNEERTSFSIAFMDEIAARGYIPMFYAAKNEMSDNRYWDMTKIDSTYKVWVSQYPATPYPQTAKSDYTGVHDMWQYTNGGTVPGISKLTDIDIAYFGYSASSAPKDTTAPEQVEANVEALMNFEDVDETVTPKDEINLRSEPTTTNDNIATTLKNGDTMQRTGICQETGWSRVIYNDQKYYAVSNFLTTDLNYKTPAVKSSDVVETVVDGVTIKTTFTPVSDTVTAKEVVNLRSIPSVTNESAKVIATLSNGENITRTGVSDNGWSRLDYNGQTVYAITSYLNIVQ